MTTCSPCPSPTTLQCTCHHKLNSLPILHSYPSAPLGGMPYGCSMPAGVKAFPTLAFGPLGGVSSRCGTPMGIKAILASCICNLQGWGNWHSNPPVVQARPPHRALKDNDLAGCIFANRHCVSLTISLSSALLTSIFSSRERHMPCPASS